MICEQCQELTKALHLLWEWGREGAVPYEASFNEAKQETEWHCQACKGTYLSKWPEWTKPTDDTFPHEEGCAYVALIRLLAQ